MKPWYSVLSRAIILQPHESKVHHWSGNSPVSVHFTGQSNTLQNVLCHISYFSHLFNSSHIHLIYLYLSHIFCFSHFFHLFHIKFLVIRPPWCFVNARLLHCLILLYVTCCRLDGTSTSSYAVMCKKGKERIVTLTYIWDLLNYSSVGSALLPSVHRTRDRRSRTVADLGFREPWIRQT